MPNPTSGRAQLASFWGSLPTEGRWLLSTVALQVLGRGLTMPFTVIYLHEVRGFTLGMSGALMAVIAMVALLVSAPGGSIVDRYGARLVLLVGTAAMMVGNVLLAFATTPAVAALAMVCVGLNFGVGFPAFNALIASVVSGETRQQYFGVNFALINLGIGVGGIIAGLVVDVDRPATFTAIFLADAACMLVPMGLLLGPLRHVSGKAPAPAPGGGPTETGTYRQILALPAVRWLTLLMFLATFIGYAQMEAGFPAYARQVSQVSTQTVGIAFAVNTAVIVCLQFSVLGRISGHRRTRVLMAMAIVWAVAWLVLGITGVVPATVSAAVGVVLFHALFAFGETLLQPSVPAITNDLAPDHLRGRYNAISAGAFQAGAIAGPLVAGVLLQHGLPVAFLAMLVAGCGMIAALALVLERHVSPQINGVTRQDQLTGGEGFA